MKIGDIDCLEKVLSQPSACWRVSRIAKKGKGKRGRTLGKLGRCKANIYIWEERTERLLHFRMLWCSVWVKAFGNSIRFHSPL